MTVKLLPTDSPGCWWVAVDQRIVGSVEHSDDGWEAHLYADDGKGGFVGRRAARREAVALLTETPAAGGEPGTHTSIKFTGPEVQALHLCLNIADNASHWADAQSAPRRRSITSAARKIARIVDGW